MIACLGWGSLLWNPDRLPLDGDWREDGPILPIEFARVSGRGRITLVVTDRGAPVRTLWVPLAVATLDEATAALAEREGVRTTRPIGRVPGGDDYPFAEIVSAWVRDMGFGGAVWTALKPGMDEKARGPVPTLAQLRIHIATLGEAERADALQYVERAPPQVQTPYREPLRAMLSGDTRADR